MQQTPFKSKKSFFDLAESDWLLNQDKAFRDWYDWLFEVFQEMNSSCEPDFLENIFSVHQKFLHKLMVGYSPKTLIGDLNIKQTDDLENENLTNILKLVSFELRGSERAGKFEI